MCVCVHNNISIYSVYVYVIISRHFIFRCNLFLLFIIPFIGVDVFHCKCVRDRRLTARRKTPSKPFTVRRPSHHACRIRRRRHTSRNVRTRVCCPCVRVRNVLLAATAEIVPCRPPYGDARAPKNDIETTTTTTVAAAITIITTSTVVRWTSCRSADAVERVSVQTADFRFTSRPPPQR